MIPQIVVDELTRVYVRELQKLSNDISEVGIGVKRYLRRGLPDFDLNLTAEEQIYREFLKDFFKANPVEVLSYNSAHYKQIIDRSLHRKLPFVVDKPDYGFKDAILLESVKDVCSMNYEAVAFISSNTAQFANSEKTDLAEELRSEVRAKRTHLHYFSSLESFLEKYGERLKELSHDLVQTALNKKAGELVWDGTFSEEYLKETFKYGLTAPVQQISFDKVILKNFYVTSLDKVNYYLEAAGKAYVYVVYWNPVTNDFWPETETHTSFKANLTYDRKSKLLNAESIQLEPIELPF